MNYRYIFTDAEYVLTEAEHNGCQQALAAGQTIMSLRGGRLGLNLSLVKHWRQTNELTPEQEEDRQKRLLLGGGDYGAGRKLTPAERAKFFCENRTRMGWEHPESCLCNVTKAEARS